MNKDYQLINNNVRLSNFDSVSYRLHDITAGEIIHPRRLKKVHIGLLEIKDIEGDEYQKQSKRICYVGELEREYSIEEFERNFNSLYGNEHIARFFVGSKKHIDEIYEAILEVLQTKTYQELLVKDIESIIDTPIGYYQIEINDEFSIIHILHYDDDVHKYMDECLKQENLSRYIKYDFTSPDLFNAYYSYWNNWMIKNSSEDLFLAYYKNLNKLEQEEFFERLEEDDPDEDDEEDRDRDGLAIKIIQKYEKE